MKTTIPTETTVVPRESGSIVLAHGEVTGHSHRIPHRSATLYRDEQDARFLRATAPVALKHEEHDTIAIPPGDYIAGVQKTWTDEDEAVNVAD